MAMVVVMVEEMRRSEAGQGVRTKGGGRAVLRQPEDR